MTQTLITWTAVSAVGIGLGLVISLLQGGLNYHLPIVGFLLAWGVWINRRLFPF